MRKTVPGHGQLIYPVRDVLSDPRVGAVQVIAPLVELWIGELHHRPVDEALIAVVLLDERPVPPDRQRVQQREELLLG